ncbi:MAG: phosphoribosylformylglycinamidine synthase subunit PurQ [Candidatus Ancaeobacter aquaticus]|nr:phosphoribosylformylglycinamidine synthase subunit PurQ [Candidatus Ancaeobacter aquaticus]
MKFGVVQFPGSNCDQDCVHVCDAVLGQKVEYIWHKEQKIHHYDCIILPGGFSYGDYLRTAAIARFSPVMKSIINYANEGGLVIGICNGFQVLLESGLLPGAMLRNTSLKFICKYVSIRTENIDTPFTSLYRPGEVLRIPVAHGEGNYFCDAKTLNELKGNNQIVFRYSNDSGMVSQSANPNGSLENIAGICNKKGNVLGMMPHPERASEQCMTSVDGFRLFQSIVNYMKK